MVGRKLKPTTLSQSLVDHLKGLPAKDRPEFVAKLVTTQKCLRSAVREASFGLVSDEANSGKVIKRIGELGAEPTDVVHRLAEANK
jgi:hypothetical protein